MGRLSVFLSSTFRDFDAERAAIKNHVAGELNESLARYGAWVEFVDLRWGVGQGLADPDEAHRAVLSVCLDEIDRAGPLVVGLVGERAGWEPPVPVVSELLRRRGVHNFPSPLPLTTIEMMYALRAERVALGASALVFRRSIVDGR